MLREEKKLIPDTCVLAQSRRDGRCSRDFSP